MTRASRRRSASTRVTRGLAARLVLLACGLLASACRGTLAPLPEWFAGSEGEPRARAESLRTSVERIVAGGWNPGRLRAIERRAAEFGLERHARREWIDWWSFQSNYLIELPGSGPELVYLVAHYDKTDANPFKLVSLLVNGVIDELTGVTYLSRGAYDNASGSAVVLELARALAEAPREHTYRILLTGAEESGLRGSRAHAARLSERDWGRIRFVVNVDSVAKDDSPNCVMEGPSDSRLLVEAVDLAEQLGIPLGTASMPGGADGDHTPFRRISAAHEVGRGLLFNLTGGLLPQRSWFVGSHRARVLVFSSCHAIDWSDLVSGQLLIPLGRLHGPRDHLGQIDPVRLWEQFELLRQFLLRASG